MYTGNIGFDGKNHFSVMGYRRHSWIFAINFYFDVSAQWFLARSFHMSDTLSRIQVEYDVIYPKSSGNVRKPTIHTFTITLATVFLIAVGLWTTACTKSARPASNVVGLDLYHGEVWPGLSGTLADAGFQVVTLDHEIDAASLAEIGILFVSSPTKPYSGREVKEIAAFVKSGGGLLCAGQTWSWVMKQQENKDVEYHPLNQLGQPLSFTVQAKNIGEPTYFDTEVMSTVSAITRTDWWPSEVELSTRKSRAIVRDDQQRIMGGLSPLENGRIVVFGHSGLLRDNPIVMVNSIRYAGRLMN
jgi:hypothetical protein